jgi:CIC family chloride channel protein
MLFRAVLVGVLAGSVAAAFRLLCLWVPHLIWPQDENLAHAVSQASTWTRILVPAAGGLIAAGVLMWGGRWAGPGRGWDILEAVVVREGVLHMKPALVKSASSLVTVATAGAVGREGSMVLLSSSVASWLGRRLDVTTRELRILVGCGIAAGIACAYNTPIGAALFTMEIILGSFALDVFAPLVFSSAAATLIAGGVFGRMPVFDLPDLAMRSRWEILLFVLLGLVCGAAAALFLVTLRGAAGFFKWTNLPRPVSMATVGLALGIAFLAFPELAGNGREAIHDLFVHVWGPTFALTLFALRLLLTSATVGSGAVGGVFTPTLFLGAVIGQACGSFFHGAFPASTSDPRSYALVGMGCLLAGTTHAPLTAVVMVFEMTLDYQIVLPLLVAAAAASLVARGIHEDSIYTEALRRKRGSEGLFPDTTRALAVRSVMRPDQVTVTPDVSVPVLLDRFIAARRNHMYVLDADGRFLGAVALRDIGGALREMGDPSAARARDLADPTFPVVTPEDSLDRALETFWSTEAERLPVVQDRQSRRLVGTLSRRDILGVYALEVLHRRAPVARFESEGENAQGPMYVQVPADQEVMEVTVPQALVGRTIAEVGVRERLGATVLVVLRRDAGGRELRLVAEAGTRLEPGDRLVLLGSRQRLMGTF